MWKSVIQQLKNKYKVILHEGRIKFIMEELYNDAEFNRGITSTARRNADF